jgi:hypothetical protein
MMMQVRINKWFGPVLLFIFTAISFGGFQYQQWRAAPPPELTWGCGEAGIIPAGVHLPAKAEFNWWLLAAQISLAVLIAVIAVLFASAIRFVITSIRKWVVVPPEFQKLNVYITSHDSLIKFLAHNSFGLRAPPVVG